MWLNQHHAPAPRPSRVARTAGGEWLLRQEQRSYCSYGADGGKDPHRQPVETLLGSSFRRWRVVLERLRAASSIPDSSPRFGSPVGPGQANQCPRVVSPECSPDSVPLEPRVLPAAPELAVDRSTATTTSHVVVTVGVHQEHHPDHEDKDPGAGDKDHPEPRGEECVAEDADDQQNDEIIRLATSASALALRQCHSPWSARGSATGLTVMGNIRSPYRQAGGSQVSPNDARGIPCM